MASYLASSQAPKNQAQPVLAQAKPAITTGAAGLRERLETAHKFSPPPATAAFGQERESFNSYSQKVRHIEDESVIQKQNASNQMRQAAVMAAVASQQKVRLSATERLAMTAKRPTTNQQIQQQFTTKPVSNNTNTNTSVHNPPAVVATNSTSNPRMGPLPTLETLLAVQRQLQQHTKQHLNPMLSQVGLGKENESSVIAERNLTLPQKSLQQQQATSYVTQPQPQPPPPPPPPTTTSFDTYEKDLPPLPDSLSPSTTTDDSQMNSLESQHSSPETSLVSLPPPPPPISSYLEQYDEVNSSCHQSIKSTSSSPCTPSTISDVSSVRHFPTLQVKPNNLTSIATPTLNPPVHQASTNHFDLPAPNARPAESVTSGLQNKVPPSKPAPKPPTPPKSQYINLYASPQPPPPPPPPPSHSRSTQATHVTAPSPLPPQSLPPTALSKQQPAQYQPSILSVPNGQHPPPRPALTEINYQKHMFNQVQQQRQTQQNPSLAFMPQPPPPLSMAASGGFDEPDSGSFRFPTPPPPDLLLDSSEDEDDVREEMVNDDEDVDDDDFQCKIPTPPPQHANGISKPMSAASFQASDLLCAGGQQQQQYQHHHHHYNNNAQPSPSPIFSSSTFSAVPASVTKDAQLQPPPLFRQQAPEPTPPPPAPALDQQPSVQPSQLTVHINNETTGLLSTANLRQAHHHHHFAIRNNNSNNNNHCNSNGHHIMLAMTASSSSPSSTSSSDNDGHSSNSSSSTSGIHSSIDSPSSSNDFNYGVAKAKTKLDLKNATNNNHLEAHLLRKNNSGGALGGSSRGGNNNSNNNQRLPATTTVTTTARRPALKQKKTVSFSDKVELVACADEQHDDHLPNPLLARVLAGKMQ